jgi:hypothetical protein
MIERLLGAFNRWFASAAGVLQTFLMVTAIVVWERFYPHADEHGFWLLYWLTVYSAVTQPALAYIARKSGDDQGATGARQEEILHHVEAILSHVRDSPPDQEAQDSDDS